MTHFFIFNNASRAANYGVGTYIRQLSEGLSICPDTAVTFIDMYANVKEFAVTTDEQGYRHYQIPAAPTGRESDTYCRCQFYLLYLWCLCLIFLLTSSNLVTAASRISGTVATTAVVIASVGTIT